MTIKHTFSYADYEVIESLESQVNPGVFHNVATGFICPICEIKHNVMHHAEKRVCKCGNEMQLYGNGLHCSMEKED